MDQINQLLLLGGALLFAAILLAGLSSRLGLPLLLVFLLVGMLAGEDGPGGIDFDDFGLSFLVGNLALAVILLDGGLRTRLSTFRVALKPALSLATLGVALTAAITGAAASALTELDWRNGLLMGAIIASTDAAAVFALLRASATRLNERMSATLEIESGINDPMAVFLTISLIEVIGAGPGAAGWQLLANLGMQFGLGVVAGLGFGWVLGATCARLQLGEGLLALLLASGGLVAFAVTNALGGSGFLAVYLVGIVAGNLRNAVNEDLLRAMDGFAWLAQSGMFLLLGLLVTPSRLVDMALPGLAVVLALTLVGRPAAVALCLAPLRFRWREILFIAWVGLRGAVPVVLALFPVMAQLPQSLVLFDIAFFVVLVSLLVQGSTVPFAARLLAVALPPRQAPLTSASLVFDGGAPHQLWEFRVQSDSPAEGAAVGRFALSPGCRIVAVHRNGALQLAPEDMVLQADDVATVVGPARQAEAQAAAFSPDPAGAAWSSRAVFGDFTVHGDTRLAELAQFYPLGEAEQAFLGETIDRYLRRRLQREPVPGDALRIGALRVTVRQMEGKAIREVGIKFVGTAAPK